MLIAAFVAASLHTRLSDAVKTAGGDIQVVSSWRDLTQTLRRRPVSVVVVDPFVGPTFEIAHILRIVQQFPSTPVIAYTTFAPAGLQAVPRLIQSGVYHVVFHRHDDTRIRFSRLLGRASRLSVAGRLLYELRSSLKRLPPRVSTVIQDMMRRPHAYRAVPAFIKAAGISKDTLYSALADAELGTPTRLFVAARVANAVAWLRDPEMLVRHVAVKVGYQRAHVLARHTMHLFGVQPRVFRTPHRAVDLTDDYLVARLLEWVQRTV
jgi:AraC-like DNA-binding protein